MVTKAKLEKLEKALKQEKKEEQEEKFLFLCGSEDIPEKYFEDEMDIDREEPLGKVYTEEEVQKLAEEFTVILLISASEKIERRELKRE